MSTVQLENVTKSFGQTVAADEVSFEVQPGEFLTLLGPSGCGKTTLLRIIAGFLRSSKGTVRIDGTVIDHLPPYLRPVGLVFQSYALFPHMTVHNNVAFGLKMRRVPRREANDRVREILDIVQLSDRATHLPAQLSGGQQQRVALARALVTQPAVLLLDEPFSALDRKIGELLRAELKRVQRRLSISTILVTHAQDEALTLSDRIAVMNQGRIEQIGPAEQLYRRPCSRFVAEFLGRSNLVRIRRKAADLRIAGPVDTPLGADGADTEIAIVRPENVVVQINAVGAPANGYAGIIGDVQYLGHTRIIRVDLDVGVTLESIALSDLSQAPAVGMRVMATIAPASFHVIGESGLGKPNNSVAD
jgi:ABC-type Fe3+/spermidine/putrescine transport system ATPase subunit